ncbi:MAG: RelA/SpoT domain-containing protein [Gammaproteobacteria bacterium]
MKPGADSATILARHNLPSDALGKTGLQWATLLRIREDYVGLRTSLEHTKDIIARELEHASFGVHSVRGRTKDPDGLLAKIIRKRLDHPENVIGLDNYRAQITDLVGVRVLHRYKRDWLPIHLFITSNWRLHEPPKAYFRPGDAEALIDEYRLWNLDRIDKKHNYRSLHYLIRHRRDNHPMQVVEIQVRTIVEEAWAEIDHLINYPIHARSPSSRDALTFLSRVSGATDEMATFLEGRYRGWEAAAAGHTSSVSELDYADLARIAQLAKLSFDDVETVLGPRQSETEAQRRRRHDEQRNDLEASSKKGDFDRALNTFYASPDGKLARYGISFRGGNVWTSIFSAPESVGMKMAANELKCEFATILPDPSERGITGEVVLEAVRVVRDRGARFWNAPMFRLRNIDFERPQSLQFSITDFFSYRFVSGTLEDELWEALLAAPAATSLKERASYLPSGTLEDVSRRTCAGGVAALFAFRRKELDDFGILLSARSTEVADAPGHMSIVPKAAHGPVVGNYDEEVKIYRTIIREIYEEIFGGDDAERVPGETAADWYVDRCPAVKELVDGTAGCQVNVTSIGIDTKQGNYLVTALIAVDSPDYWVKHEAAMTHMWEHKSRKPTIISSKDTSALVRAITDYEWSHDALVGYCEGLLELKRLFPDAVDIGDLARELEGAKQ